RLKTESVPDSPRPLRKFARHSSKRLSNSGCDSFPRSTIQTERIEYARLSRNSGSVDPRRPLNSRASAKADSPSGIEQSCLTIERQNSRPCAAEDCASPALALPAAGGISAAEQISADRCKTEAERNRFLLLISYFLDQFGV